MAFGDHRVNSFMVYDTETYELCHKLAPEAEDSYRKILEDAATEMLLKH